jgi:protein-disulfide isomerase
MQARMLAVGVLLAACAGRYGRPTRCVDDAQELSAVALDDAPELPAEGAPRLGPSNAPVTVVVFSDLACPHCARGRVALGDVRARFPRAVRLVWRDLPGPSHPDALAAAEAAREARVQGGDALFWRFTDVLFAHPGRLGRPWLERYAADAGLDLARLRDALDRHTHAEEIAQDRALAERLGVEGTPTVFVNGTRVEGAARVDLLEALVERNLARSRSLAPSRRYADAVREPIPVPVELLALDAWERVHIVPIAPESPALGPAHAPVTLQVFSDYACPYCARVEPTLRALRERYGDRLRIVWRDHPLARHPEAMPAAEAAREARAQGGDALFWRYHDTLFAHQDEPQGLSREALERYALALDLDVARLRLALDAHTHAEAVRTDLEAMAATGLRTGTPAFFLNGHFFAGARPEAEFRARIDRLLRDLEAQR